MRERLEQILKMVCLALALLLLVQLVKAAFHVNPLRGVSVPELPSLPVDTNAVVAKATNSVPIKPGTNSAAANASNTNTPAIAADTNTVSKPKPKKDESNSAPVLASQPKLAVTPSTNGSETNAAIKMVSGTNGSVGGLANTNAANAAIAKKSKPKNPAMAGPMAMMAGPGGKKAPSLPPEVQARVDRVTDSEILAPVIHPLPLALLGIAGNVAFLRTAGGQTGLVKEGDSLGEIKLLRIGINRVLIEQDGQQKELTIFSGYGGESLLPKPGENSHETTKN